MTFDGVEATAWVNHVSEVVRVALSYQVQRGSNAASSQLAVGDILHSWHTDSQGNVSSSVLIMKTV